MYLEQERQAAFKSQYFGGEIFAMAGGSRVAQPHQHERWRAAEHAASRQTLRNISQ
jgi:hypothetical protein